MRTSLAILAAALMVTASCAHAEQIPTAAPPPMPSMFEAHVANITTEENASAFCNAAATQRGAHWPGLYWTQRPGGPSTCVLTANAPDVVQPIISSSNCELFGGPFECIAIQNAAGDGDESVERVWFNSSEMYVSYYERPDTASRMIEQIAPGGRIVILDFQSIAYFTHRGVFRTPYPRLGIEAGQVVVPTYSTRTTPWIDGPRYNPQLMGSDTMTYPQRQQILRPGDGPRLDIVWEELPHPTKASQLWALVRLPDGTIGWADFEALEIDLGLEDE